MLTAPALDEYIALSEQEAADRKPIQLRDDALAEEEAQRLINNAYEGNVNRALISACQKGKTSAAVRLVRHHSADVHDIESDACLKYTPLHRAASAGRTETVLALVKELGADVNAKDWMGKTPLHYASSHGRTEIARVLVKELGVDVNAIDDDGKTPLYDAAYKGHTDTARALVKELGADVNAKDSNGRTPLEMVSSHREEFRAFLLR